MLANIMVVIILQYISNEHVLYLKLTQHYVSIVFQYTGKKSIDQAIDLLVEAGMTSALESYSLIVFVLPLLDAVIWINCLLLLQLSFLFLTL